MRNLIATQDNRRPAPWIGLPAGNLMVAILSLCLLPVLTVLYIAFAPPPQRQSWDSLMYPSLAEGGGFGGVQGNHPLGHVIQFGFFFLAHQLGYVGRALPVFQGVSAVAGGCAVMLLFLLSVRVLRNSVLSSLAIALMLAGCYSFWSLAGGAQIYCIAIGFSFLTWIVLLLETMHTRRHLLLISGASVGLAILAHQLNAVLLLVGIVLILGQRTHWQSRLVSFLCATALVAGMGYLLMGALATSSTSPATIIAWARGYIGTYASTGRYLTWRYLPNAWKQATEGVVFSVWSSRRFKAVSNILWAAMGLFVLARATQWRSLSGSRRTILVAALAQWSASFLLIWYWEPFEEVYWSLTLVPAAIALASLDGSFVQTTGSQPLRAPRVLERGQRILLMALAAAILGLSLYRGIKAESNEALASGATWATQSSAQDLLIPPPELVAYLKFWENRPNTKSLIDESMVAAGLQGRLARLRLSINDVLCHNRSVYFAPASIDMLYQDDIDRFAPPDARDQLRMFFGGYQEEAAFSYVDNGRTIQVNRILGPTQCAESDSSVHAASSAVLNGP